MPGLDRSHVNTPPLIHSSTLTIHCQASNQFWSLILIVLLWLTGTLWDTPSYGYVTTTHCKKPYWSQHTEHLLFSPYSCAFLLWFKGSWHCFFHKSMLAVALLGCVGGICVGVCSVLITSWHFTGIIIPSHYKCFKFQLVVSQPWKLSFTLK